MISIHVQASTYYLNSIPSFLKSFVVVHKLLLEHCRQITYFSCKHFFSSCWN